MNGAPRRCSASAARRCCAACRSWTDGRANSSSYCDRVDHPGNSRGSLLNGCSSNANRWTSGQPRTSPISRSPQRPVAVPQRDPRSNAKCLGVLLSGDRREPEPCQPDTLDARLTQGGTPRLGRQSRPGTGKLLRLID